MLSTTHSLPDKIKCPNCQEELELDEKEKSEKKFVCPECNMLIDMSQTTDINNIRKISVASEITPFFTITYPYLPLLTLWSFFP